MVAAAERDACCCACAWLLLQSVRTRAEALLEAMLDALDKPQPEEKRPTGQDNGKEAGDGQETAEAPGGEKGTEGLSIVYRQDRRTDRQSLVGNLPACLPWSVCPEPSDGAPPTSSREAQHGLLLNSVRTTG